MTKVDVKEAVREFVTGGKMFTSVDVGNEVKKAGTWIRNRDVASELRHLFRSGDSVFDGYDMARIAVDGGASTATLYLPCGSDPEDYKERNQKALGPVAAKPGVGAAPTAATRVTPAQAPSITRMPPQKAVVLKRAPRTMVTQKVSAADITDVLTMNIVMSKVIRTTERIKIPSGMIRKLGWKPGQLADLSRIMTHNEVKVGVIVASDYRVSIPRSAVGWDTKPVKVMLTSDDTIIFDKA